MHWQPDPVAWKISLAVILIGWAALSILALFRFMFASDRSDQPTSAPLPDNVVPLFPGRATDRGR